jgi:phosphopantothenoylcysteine decarboxylase/phosphopantothenate--cysteine ligase
MGIALAKELAERGAKVKLILGPSALKVKHPNIDTIRVTNAQSMYEAAQNHFEKSHISILAAAVADYRPINVADQKIKKKEKRLTIELEKTMDIAATLGKQKRDNQLLIGFALETNNEIENAKGKLMRKNLDFIVLNSLKDQGAGFAVDTNKITILRKDNKIKEFELKSKTKVAIDIVNEIVLMIE